MEDRHLELNNNRVERNIKPFVIGHKNFRVANTLLGTRSSAVIYSLVEMAKETSLISFHSLAWVLEIASSQGHTVDGCAVPLLPANAPLSCTTT